MFAARIILFIIGAGSAFIVSPWVTAVCAVILSLRWRAWEAVLLGFLVDVLWLPSTFLYGLPLATLLALLIVWILEPLRNELLVDQPVL
jgi:hypothetical protein